VQKCKQNETGKYITTSKTNSRVIKADVDVRFVVLTSVDIKHIVCWNVMLSNLINSNIV
jgi:hypothetical protein